MTVTFDIYAQKDPRSICRAVCLWLLYYSDRDLMLNPTFLTKTFVLTHSVPISDINSPLSEFELFAAHITGPRAQNVKKLHLDPWPDIDLTHHLNLKRISMDLVVSTISFKCRLFQMYKKKHSLESSASQKCAISNTTHSDIRPDPTWFYPGSCRLRWH